MRGFFDFETYGGFNLNGKTSEEVKPYCCGFLTDSGDESFLIDEGAKNPDKLAESVLKHMYAHYDVHEWWAHNMGNFDGLIISAAATRLGWNQTGMVAGSRVIMLQLSPKNSKRVITLCDTYALVPDKLVAIAKDFELASQKLFNQDDYGTDVRTWNRDRLIKGCMADCYVLRDLLNKLDTLAEQWGGKVKKTFSSTALGIARHSVEKSGEKLPNHFDNPTINPIARNAYYGARVEVLHHMPKGKLIEYDVCSSYPASMAKPLPWAFLEHVRGIQANRAYRNPNVTTVCNAWVSVPENVEIPALPYRPKNGGVFFPIGEWRGWFPGCELEYAESLGYGVKILEALVYTKESRFTEFINELYALKSTSKGALRQFCKLGLNGAYGKFGEKPEHSNLKVFASEFEAMEYQFENPGKCAPLDSNGLMYSISYEKWANHAHYGIASYITGYSRILLHQYLIDSDSPAYCDTDSIHCKSWNGETSNLLGALKVEIPSFSAEFFAPKVYRIYDDKSCGSPKCTGIHLAAKGFPVNTDSFDRMIQTAVQRLKGRKPSEMLPSEKVRVERIKKLKTQLRSGGTKTERITQFKTWAGFSAKRKPYQNGETSPWTVQEIDAGIHKRSVSPALLPYVVHDMKNTISNVGG